MSRVLTYDASYSSLVTYEEFALFIREEGYFRREYWDRDVYREFWSGHAGRQEFGGDELLRRIGFHWTTRHLPVTHVSWFEADAYCKSVGGRLPWSVELDVRTDSLEDVGDVAEWCGDWFNSRARGPNVKPEPPFCRRVANWSEDDKAVPELSNVPIGFRVMWKD